MKTNDYIFKTLIFTLFLMLTAIAANSQGTIQTPMGQTVGVLNGSDDTYWLQYWEARGAAEVSNNGWDAVRIGAATSNYNCHSYAWNVVEAGGSLNKWMNQTVDGNPNLSKYWTNDAYTSTGNVADHEKIFYSTGDHSAITTATSGKVRSKWGAWPLYEHSTAQCPYNAGSLTYYTLKSLSISNSTAVFCSNTQRTLNNGFTASNWTYDWNASGSLYQVSGDFSPNYIVSSNSSVGYGTINLTVTSPSGMTASVQKGIGVNMPYYADLSFSLYTNSGTPVSYMCPNQHYHIYLNNNSGCSLSSYAWSVPSGWSINYTWSNMVSVYTGSTPGGRVEVSATTCCGVYTNVITGYFGSGYCGNSFAMSLSPNPSNGETTLSIEPTSEDVVLDENAEWSVEIFDQAQCLREQKTKMKGKEKKINTVGWKTGIYLVRVKYKDEYLQGKLVVQ